ncbi:MAG TPA: hypothetical protein VGM54_01115 [Chthoniobacter sp.]|jgi:hypothetical protein
MIFRKYALAAVAVLVLWALWLLWLWQPERQVRLHTTHFLKKVERRNWPGAGAFVAEDYSDRWGLTKTTALQDAQEVFQQFIFLTIENRTDNCEILGNEGTAHTLVKVSGKGGPIGEVVMERVNGLRAPFSFTWRHVGKAPWRWELIRIDQSELNIDPNISF